MKQHSPKDHIYVDCTNEDISIDQRKEILSLAHKFYGYPYFQKAEDWDTFSFGVLGMNVSSDEKRYLVGYRSDYVRTKYDKIINLSDMRKIVNSRINKSSVEVGLLFGTTSTFKKELI